MLNSVISLFWEILSQSLGRVIQVEIEVVIISTNFNISIVISKLEKLFIRFECMNEIVDCLIRGRFSSLIQKK